MRLVFAGTPIAAVPSLDALVGAGHDIAAVVTRTDARIGRKGTLTPSPIAARSQELGLNTIKSNTLDETVTSAIEALHPELGIVVAYGGLVRARLLAIPDRGWINLHFSLLPRWRGASPVQRAIEAGDRVTGASVFALVEELDAGDLYSTAQRTIGRDETAGELLDALAVDGAALLTDTVAAISAGTAVAQEQTGTVTLAPKLTLDDARVRWDQPLEAVYNRIRAVTPEPGAFTEIATGRLKIIAARESTSQKRLAPGVIDGADGEVLIGTATLPLRLVTVQPAGKREMPASDWMHGIGRARSLVAR